MKFDVIVAGGGTAGCACAYVSAKLGLKVLLVEKNSFLGGSMTSSLVTPAMKTSENNINSDFYRTLMAELHKIGGQITYSDGNIGWFNPELMKITLDKMMSDVGVQVLFNTKISDIQKTDTIIKRVLLSDYNDTKYSNNININNKMLSEYIETIYLVDGTGDAKIFEKLNCDFLENFDKNKKYFQPINLRFIMSGINIEKFSKWIMELDPDRDVTTSALIDGQIHLSTAYTWDTDRKWALEPVFKAGIEKGLITEEDSNYFQVFTIAGMPSALAFNCPRIISKNDINPEDCVETSDVLTSARASIYRLSEFFKVSFEGFEDAYISQIANELGIRVSKRIKGKYIYTIDDLRSGKTFDNPCLISNYPVDIHSSDKDGSVLEKQEQEYMLPIESLQSCQYENLFAVGRCISADFEAQAALRIIPSCFSMGEGLAKYMAENI
ncbi:FAD-dependent oxidoreductase [bacterium]|nr:FAD-dependent oxidoreductase [bacterium]